MVKIWLIVLLLSVGTVNGQQPGHGLLQGKLFDLHDAMILGTEVTVARKGFEKSVFPNVETGEFTFELEPGIYSITSKRNWWLQVRRALIEVKGDETTMVNLNPTLRVLSVALEVSSNGSRDVPDYSYVPKYDELLPSGDSPLNAVIEYQQKKTRSSITEYKNAKLSFNHYSLTADVLKFDRKALSFDARGHVMADEGGKRQRAEKLEGRLVKP